MDTAEFFALCEVIGRVASAARLDERQRQNVIHEASRRYWDDEHDAPTIATEITRAVEAGVEFSDFLGRRGTGRPEASSDDAQLRWDLQEGGSHGGNGG